MRLREQAPNTRLVVTQGSRHGMLEQVAQGKIDLALGVFPSVEPEDPVAVRLPHARGGVSDLSLLLDSATASSPRPWGCFPAEACDT